MVFHQTLCSYTVFKSYPDKSVFLFSTIRSSTELTHGCPQVPFVSLCSFSPAAICPLHPAPLRAESGPNSAQQCSGGCRAAKASPLPPPPKGLCVHPSAVLPRGALRGADIPIGRPRAGTVRGQGEGRSGERGLAAGGEGREMAEQCREKGR